jgi:hypothetical protein
MSAVKSGSRFKDNIHVCPDWATITREFDKLSKPVWRRDEEDEAYHQGWVFRGRKRETYDLAPLIERVYRHGDWAEAEYKALQEFKSKARMHMDPVQIPEADDPLGWLAVMQHYGAPTRLLDFTYSPYVALYFALRDRDLNESEHVEVWGIREAILRERADKTSLEADIEVRQPEPKSHGTRKGFLRNPDMASPLQRAQREEQHQDKVIRKALSPCVKRRQHFNGAGFVALALPPFHNPRLSSQQGLFLLNGADSLSFEESLDRMMQGEKRTWYKRFRVPQEALKKIEEQLFQLNIHELLGILPKSITHSPLKPITVLR